MTGRFSKKSDRHRALPPVHLLYRVPKVAISLFQPPANKNCTYYFSGAIATLFIGPIP
jgi:hypothetical protein